ncbi:hypothetical protein QUC31_020315 [Theobroma cacao]
MLGHLHFAEAVLNSRPELASELDSQGFSPLHLASANGYTEMVKLLLSVNPDMCLAREEDGRTPLHLAVMKGRVDVIQELVHVNSEAAQYTLNKGETLLNLAVEHNRLKTTKLLVELGRDKDIVNIKDRDGNSVLHVAVSVKRIETVKYLLNETAVEVNAVNQNGFAALDIIANMPRDLKGMEIHESLLNAIALRSRRIPASESGITQFIEASEKPKVPVNSEAIAASGAGNNKKKHLKNDDRLNKKYDTLMVAASVVAAMAYQEGFSPPGGVWDHDSDYFHTGQSVLATYDSKLYSIFWIFNTVSFISSISTLFLLVSGLPLKQRIYVWILTATMCVTLTSMVVTHCFYVNYQARQ